MKPRPGTVVDSGVLLDVFTDDPVVVLAEVSPRFSRLEELRTALPARAIDEPLPDAAAFLAGHAHQAYRRAGGARQAVLPDFLIGAHAAVTGRPLLTRDPRRGRHAHPRDVVARPM